MKPAAIIAIALVLCTLIHALSSRYAYAFDHWTYDRWTGRLVNALDH